LKVVLVDASGLPDVGTAFTFGEELSARGGAGALEARREVARERESEQNSPTKI